MHLKILSLFAVASLIVPASLPAQEQTVPRRISIEKTASIPLILNGVPGVEIVLPEKSSPVVTFAAKELQEILSASFGTKIPVVLVPSESKTSIILGDNAFSKKAGIRIDQIPRDGFVILTQGNRIYIAGKDDPNVNVEQASRLLSIWANYFERGTLNGVYDFVEHFCGVRFYFPGELGTIIPEHRNLLVPNMNILERPDNTVRLYTWYLGEWFDKSPVWGKDGVRAKTLSMYRNRHETQYLPCNHGLLSLNYHGRFKNTHPEYFSIIDGKRSNFDKHPYLCFNSGIVEEIYQDAKAFFSGKDMSSRDAVNQYGGTNWDPSACQKGYFNIMPQDGFRMCECPACRKIKSKLPVSGVPDKEISNHIWGVTAKIAQRLKDEGIFGTITQMAYWPYNCVPDFDLPDNILVMVGLCGPWKPEERDYLIPAWTKKLNRKVWLWNYAGKFGARALPLVPDFTPRAIGKYYASKKDQIFGAYMESATDRYIYHSMNYYVFGKVMWNVETDVESLMEEHYRLMYGKAAPVMKRLMEQVEKDWLTRLSGEVVENEFGVFNQFPSEYKIWNEIYPSARLRAMEQEYAKAELLAETELQKRRIRLMKQEFLNGLQKLSEEYHGNIRQAEEWMISVPEHDSVSAYLHKVSDGANTQGHIRIQRCGSQVRCEVVNVPWKGMELLLNGKNYPFRSETLSCRLPESPEPFDLIRRENGKIVERWNFFLDSDTVAPEAFGRIRCGNPDDGSIVVNGDLTGEKAAPWFGPLYAKSDYGAYLDQKIFLSGGQSMRLESKGKYSTSMWQDLPGLKPNTRYRITFYVKLENVVPYNSSGGVISACYDQVNRWYPAGPLTGTMPWTKQYNEIVTGPETNQKHRSYFNVSLRNASGKVWVDNIRIHEMKDKEKK